MTKMTTLSTIITCRFFLCRTAKEKKNTMVLLSVFRDKYLSWSPLSLTPALLKLQTQDCVPWEKKAFLQLNSFYFQISQTFSIVFNVLSVPQLRKYMRNKRSLRKNSCKQIGTCVTHLFFPPAKNSENSLDQSSKEGNR